MSQAKMSILIVDDEPIKVSVLQDALEDAGFDVALASRPAEALAQLAKRSFDVILSDIRMPGMDGITFLRQIKAASPRQAVLIMTAFGSVDSAVEAMKLGAFDYLQKPFSSEQLILKLDRLRRYTGLERTVEKLHQELAAVRPSRNLVGESAATREIRRKIHALAGSTSAVLIEGESGTGKEVVARMIHDCSPRSDGPFVAVSCAALPESLVEDELFGHEPGAFTGAIKRRHGRFELASGGTLFLDDIDDVPQAVQVKLLRVLQEYQIERVGGSESIPVDIRLIAATKCSLRDLVRENQFREDLFYRLSVIPIRLPPLRERTDDVAHLVAYFLDMFARRQGRATPQVTEAAMQRLQAYGWPGNVRELEHAVEQILVMQAGDRIDVTDLPEMRRKEAAGAAGLDLAFGDRDAIDLEGLLHDVETRAVEWALARADGNLARAAEMLGMPRSTLQYRLTKLNLAKPRR